MIDVLCSLSRLRPSAGIALGPILFIIAVLAVLAAAIAAGSGGFNGNISTEQAKSNAETIINTAHSYNDALQLVLHNGCNETQIDWTPNGGYPYGATSLWSVGDYSVNGTGHTGNGQCAMFDPRGGGIIYRRFPSAALLSPATGAYTSLADGGVNEDAFAGYPLLFGTLCALGLGTCPLAPVNGNAALIMFVPYLNYATCKQINAILGIGWDPKSTTIHVASDYQYNLFLNISGAYGGYGAVRSAPAPNAGYNVGGGGPVGYSGVSEACAYDDKSNNQNSAFVYMYTIMVR